MINVVLFTALFSAVSQAGDPALGHLSQAAQAMQAGNYSEALELYRRAQQEEPTDWRAFQGAGNACSLLEDFPGAVENYQRALALKGGQDPALEQRIALLKQRMGPEEAPPATAPSREEKLLPPPPPPAYADESAEEEPAPRPRANTRRRPRQGAIVMDLDLDLGSTNGGEFDAYYGPYSGGTPGIIRVGADLALSYAISEDFQLGLGSDSVEKDLTWNGPFGYRDVWMLSATGFIFRAKYLYSLNPHLSWATEGALGSYSLDGSTITTTLGYGSGSDVLNLTGKASGAYFRTGLEVYPSLRKRFGLSFALEYRSLTFKDIKGSGYVNGFYYSNAQLVNWDLSNFKTNLGGLGFMMGTSIYFGGSRGPARRGG